jgi:hypothetical protein
VHGLGIDTHRSAGRKERSGPYLKSAFPASANASTSDGRSSGSVGWWRDGAETSRALAEKKMKTNVPRAALTKTAEPCERKAQLLEQQIKSTSC